MNTILLGNLIKIRWIAIIGQILAICFVFYFINIQIPFFETLVIIFLSVALNFYSYFEERKNKSISNIKAFLFLLFDTLQLGFLLFLTGGIINPFSILILAPVITSASYLPAVMTVVLSTISIGIIVILNFYFIPLDLGAEFYLPQIYSFGLVASLIITVIFIAIYAYLFASSSRKISNALSVSKLQILNQKKITEVGSLSAAAAHELGTPLNTIFLIINDLLKEKILIDNKNIAKDIILLKSQAERCREILQSFSKNPLKLKDKFLEKVKITDLIKINFEKFNKNKKLIIKKTPFDDEPEIIFKDEIMYALGNIIQNAIFYSKTNVTAELNYNNVYVKIIIIDDGEGFSKDIIDKLGDPYISKNNQGMGLGIFIAKNLIENMGGNINFYNSKDDNANVEIVFNNSILDI
ncbi:ActS/PrrB/RegB family redox-sensitive histidine kinase [Pelagibacteraceae bacterium]|nr:ActS/PrrB/RegB family redox-sensitive histidine kinase [Pelagibacteraceae bacterium]